MLVICALFGAMCKANAGVVIGTVGSTGLDFNNDGTIDFRITNVMSNTNACLIFDWAANGHNIWTNGTLSTGGWDDIVPITANTSIGSSGNWEAQGDAYIVNYYGESLFSTGESYVGFRLGFNGETYYGWAKVNITGSEGAYQVQWLQCAYESTPNTAILAGSTGSSSGICENTKTVFVAPNPTTEYVRVLATVEDASQVMVFDNSGKRVAAPVMVEADQFRVDLSNLRSGVYFIRFKGCTVRVMKA